VTLVEKVDEWYSTNLAKFAEVVGASRPADRQPQTFASIGAARLTPFQFHTSGMLNSACELLRGLGEVPGHLIRGIELIVGRAYGVFGFLPMPNLTDALSASTPDSLRNRLVTYELRIGPGIMTGMNVGIKFGLAALDGLDNARKRRVLLESS
jgi:hypothetical protein